MRGKPRRRRADIDDQIDQRGIRLEQRKKLHPRGQPRKEAVELAQRLFGACSAVHALQDLGLDAPEDRLRPVRAQRRIMRPGLDDRLGLGAKIGALGHRAGGKERPRQRLDPGQPILQPRRPGRGIARPHHPRDPVDPLGRGRHQLCLRIVHHLDAMLDLAMLAVVIGQFARHIGGHPTLDGQFRQPPHGGAVAQIGVTPARDQLPCLGEEFDLADTALTQLQIVPGHLDRTAQPLVGANAQPHVMGILNRGEIQMLAPDKGGQRLQKPLARRDVARTGPRLDIGGALPGPPLRLVIKLRRPHRDADGRDRSIRAQPQICAKDIALGGDVIDQGRHFPRHPDKGRPRLHPVIGGELGLVEKADQVDIRGIIELERPHLAHRQSHHATRAGGVVRPLARQLAPADLIGDKTAQSQIDSRVGKLRQRQSDPFQRPDAPQIGQRGQHRHPPLRPAQLGPQRLKLNRLQPGDLGLERRQQIARQRGAKPLRLALQKPGQIGRTARRARDQIPDFGRKIAVTGGDIGATGRVKGDRRAGQAGCKAHGARLSAAGAGSMGGKSPCPFTLAKISRGVRGAAPPAGSPRPCRGEISPGRGCK